MWLTQPLEIADAEGKPTGRWRMTASSDEGGGGPHGNRECSHGSAAEAQACEACDEYLAGVTGFPSRKRFAEQERASDIAELARLKAKYPEA